MTERMELEAMLTELSARPADDTLLLAIADRLQEGGDETRAVKIREHVRQGAELGEEPPQEASGFDRIVWYRQRDERSRERRRFLLLLRLLHKLDLPDATATDTHG